MKNKHLKINLVFLLSALVCSYSAIAQSISPINITASSGDCTATPKEVTFTLTTVTIPNPGYSWRIGCSSNAGVIHPPVASIMAVGGGSNPATCSPAVEILNTGINKTITIRINNLAAIAEYEFALEVYDASGPTGALIIAQDINIEIMGNCAAPVCCAILSTPNPVDDDRAPGEAFIPITLSEQNNTTTGLTWKIQFENPPASGTFVDATLGDLPGVGLSLGSGGPFNLATSTASTVYFGGSANGVIGTKAKMKVVVTHGADHAETPPFTYSIGLTGAGNALIIPLKVSDTRMPAIPLGNCNVALNPLSFKGEVTDAAAWVASVSNDHAPHVIPKLFSNTVINKPGIDLKNYFNKATEADDLIKFAKDAIAELAIDPTILTGQGNIIFALDNCLESKEGKIAHYATMQQIDIGGGKMCQVSIHGRNNTWKDVAHSLANNFGIRDAFDLASPPAPLRATLQDWDEMAKIKSDPLPFAGVQPSAFSKFWPAPKWATYSEVLSIKPGASAVTSPSIDIVFPYVQPSGSEKRAVAILLDGSNSISDNSKFYVVIEARDKTNYDENLNSANGGVIYYLADRNTPQGYSPLTSISTLPLAVGGSTSASDPLFTKYGIKIKSVNNYVVGTTQKGYEIVIEHKTPPKSDVSINKGTPDWTSPDIDVIIPLSASNVCKQGDIFSTTLQNIINASLHNTSGIPALDVQAKFYFACPTPSFDWYEIGSTLVGELAGNGSTSIILNPQQAYHKENGTATETKTVANCISGGASHICVRVDLSAINDGTTTNNTAQQNLTNKTACSGSPYPPIDHIFQVRNKESYRTPVYLKAEQVPTNWTYSFIPASLNLGPNEEAAVTLRLSPPDGLPFCSDFAIPVTAWAPKGHTIIQLGGLSVIAHLRQGTKLTMNTKLGPCRLDSVIKVNPDGTHNEGHPNDNNVNNDRTVYHHYNEISYRDMFTRYVAGIYKGGKKNERQCATIYSTGCTQPPRPNQLVNVMYQDPGGNPVIKEVMTDASGCFSDEFTTLEGGNWEITAIYNGDNCSGGALTTTEVKVPIRVTEDQDNDDVPDDQEVQGDFDHDNLPGQLDPDSDNDNVPDGNEPTGDLDCDGLPNPVDPDSDNDGIVDGKDSSPYGNTPQYKVFLSAMYHRFDFSSDLPIKDGNGFNIRAGINFNPKWGIEGEAGFTPTEDIDKQSGTVTNINVNALYYFKSASLTPYLTAGAGALLFNGFTASDNTFALNGGGGFFFAPPIMSGALTLRAEIKGHYGLGGYDTNGNFNLQYSLGITYRIRTKATPCRIEKATKASHKR